MKAINIFKLIIPIVFCIGSAFYTGTNSTHEGYTYIYTLHKSFITNSYNPFLIVFTFIAFLRYVILPILIVYSDYYGGRSIAEPLEDSFIYAIHLMNWELICASFAIYFFSKIYKKNTNVEITISKRKNYIYYLFIAFSLLLALAFPKGLLAINFVFQAILPTDLDTASSIDNLVSYSVIISKSLIFLMIIKSLGSKYHSTSKLKYMYIALVVSMFNILIYWGTNRSDILISAIATSLTLVHFFGAPIKKYFVLGAVVMLTVLTLVTQSREHASVSGGFNKSVDITDAVQAYTGGPYNVAIAVETKNYFPESQNLKVLLFDIFRPMIGVNLLIKNSDQAYSNMYFNDRIWLHVDRRSQILPMIGQGNLFFGFFFAPVLTVFFVFLAFYIRSKIFISSNIEIYYFFNLALIRLGFMLGQNTMNMVNDLSMNLFLFLFVYFLNKKFSKLKS